MRRRDLGSSLFLLALALVIGYESTHLGLGTWRMPGPGFLPFWTALVLVFLSAAIFASALLKRKAALSPAQPFWSGSENRKRVLLVLASLIAYDLIWTRLGFSLSTLLFLAFLFGVVGKRRWRTVIVGAALISATAYLLFETLLKAQLPPGIVGF